MFEQFSSKYLLNSGWNCRLDCRKNLWLHLLAYTNHLIVFYCEYGVVVKRVVSENFTNNFTEAEELIAMMNTAPSINGLIAAWMFLHSNPQHKQTIAMLVCCLPKRNYVCFRCTMSYEAKITELLLLPVEEPRSKSEPIMDLPCLMLDKATVKIIFAQYNSRNVLLYCLFWNI